MHLPSSPIPAFPCLTCTQQLLTKAGVRSKILWRLYKFKILTLSDQYLTIKFQIKSSGFWFFKLEFKFQKQSIPDAHPDSWVINILKYFWNIQQLYYEVSLQFMGTWLFKCKQNGQILYFSSFWSSPYQMHNQTVE